MTPQKLLKEAMAEHKAGDVETAKSLYEQILTQTPDDPDVLNLLGVLYLQFKNFNKALEFIQRAIDIDPQIAGYHYNLGQVLNEQGDIKGATVCYQKALERNPGLTVASDQLRSLSAEAAHLTPNTPKIQKEMMRYEVVQHMIDRTNARTYLEIGVDSGESFIKTRAQTKIGVDPVPTPQLVEQALKTCEVGYLSLATTGSAISTELKLKAGIKNPIAQMNPNESMQLFYTTSDEFFKNNAEALFCKDKVDVAFVDGLHTFQQTYQDVLNVLDHLNDNGIILLHDCNPPTASTATPAMSWQEVNEMAIPGWDGLWCGDVWKSIVYLKSQRDDLNVFVLDCDFGIGVVSRGTSADRVNYTADQIKAMDFEDLDRNRRELLNLKPQDYLFEFLQTIGRC